MDDFAVEHDDTTSRLTAELVTVTGLFDDVVQRTDLAGRPRFVTARARARAEEHGKKVVANHEPGVRLR